MNCDHCGGRLNAMRVRDARIVELARQGKSRKEIMELLNLTPRVVYTVIQKSGVKPGKTRHYPKTALLDKSKDMIIDMVVAKKTHHEIAAHFGVSKSTVDKFILEAGLRTRAKRRQGLSKKVSNNFDKTEPVVFDANAYAALTKNMFHRPLNALRAA